METFEKHLEGSGLKNHPEKQTKTTNKTLPKKKTKKTTNTIFFLYKLADSKTSFWGKRAFIDKDKYFLKIYN